MAGDTIPVLFLLSIQVCHKSLIPVFSISQYSVWPRTPRLGHCPTLILKVGSHFSLFSFHPQRNSIFVQPPTDLKVKMKRKEKLLKSVKV